MSKTIAIVFILVGLVLLGMGFIESETLVSEVSEVFTGQPSDYSVFLTVSSIVLLFTGGVLLVNKSDLNE